MTKTMTIILMLSYAALAQNKKQPGVQWKFDTDYFDAVNHWVVLPKNEADSIYQYGYVYLNVDAGFTFVLENTFNKSFEDIHSGTPKHYIIQRQFNKYDRKVYVMKAEDVEYLGLPEKPEWLKIYDANWETAEDLSKRGFRYNAVGCYKSAIPLFEKAYKLDAHFQHLEHQLAYAYNATMQFEKAMTLLIKAIKYSPGDCMLYRELGFALIKSDLYDDAERIYEFQIPFCNDKAQQSEMCLDMLQTFFRLNNKSKFDKWSNVAKQYAQSGSTALKYIDTYEKNMSRKESKK